MKKIGVILGIIISISLLLGGCNKKVTNDIAPTTAVENQNNTDRNTEAEPTAEPDKQAIDDEKKQENSQLNSQENSTGDTLPDNGGDSSEINNETPAIEDADTELVTFTVNTIEKDGITYFDNPIIDSIYTADPAPMVYGDTLYLYTTHDEDVLENDFYTMKNWHCYSTKDMVNWVDHGEVFSLDDIKWADDRAWAAQAVERNGKFYLYCPVHKKYGGMAIAVGVSDTPTGPFTAWGFAVVDEGDWNDIDPTVFIDDDGQAYLYFGNPELRYVILKDVMLTYDKSIGVVKVEMTTDAFGEGPQSTGTTYAEGPWFYKRNGIYYMVYAAFINGHGSEQLAYSTAPTATGPWTYQGILMTDEGGTYTNHPGIVDFNGHSYLFYHTQDLPGGSLFHRSVCVAEFIYNEDGTIDTIKKINYKDIVKE